MHNNRHLPAFISLLLLLPVLWGCSGGDAPGQLAAPGMPAGEEAERERPLFGGFGSAEGPAPAPPLRTSAFAGLPRPRELKRTISGQAPSRIRIGAEFDPFGISRNVEVSDDSLVFSPAWTREGDSSALAFASYRFDLPEYDGAPGFGAGWSVPPADGAWFIGLGNQQRNTWDWLEFDGGEAELDSFAPYLTAGGEVIALVVVAASGSFTLDWVRAGENFAPVAAISADPESGPRPLSVTLDAGGSSDVDGDVVSYLWDLDSDGLYETNSGATATQQVTLNNTGVVHFGVVAVDDDEAQGYASVEVSAYQGENQPPVAILAADPLSGVPPLEVSFDASGSFDPDDSITLYQWDFDGDGTYDAMTMPPVITHTYTNGGLYRPQVKVTDSNFASATATATIDLASGPVAELSLAPVAGQAPHLLDVDASASYDPDGEIVLYEWDWEPDGVIDGHSDDMPVFNYSLWLAGTYVPEVHATDDSGITSVASGPEITVHGWSRSHGGYKHEEYNAVASDYGAAYYAAGYAASWGATQLGIIAKFTPEGELSWQKLWGQSGDDVFTAVDTDVQGNVYVGGFSWSFAPGGGDDLLVVRFDSSGNQVWARTWGRDKYDYATDLAASGTGSVYTVGNTRNLEFSSMRDIVVLKHGSSGNALWGKTYSAGRGDQDPYVLLDDAEYLLITGNTNSGAPYGLNGLMLKVSPAGNLVSQHYWGADDKDAFIRATRDSAGNLYVVGYTESWGGYRRNALIVKFNSAMEQQWARVWSTEYHEEFTSVVAGTDGKIHVYGTLENPSEDYGYYGLALVYSPAGELLESKQLVTAGITKIWDAVLADEDVITLAGATMRAMGFWEDWSGTETTVTDAEFGALEGTLVDAAEVVTSEPAPALLVPADSVEDLGGGNYDSLILRQEL